MATKTPQEAVTNRVFELVLEGLGREMRRMIDESRAPLLQRLDEQGRVIADLTARLAALETLQGADDAAA